MIEIKNLHVTADDKKILKGLDLSVNAGEIHAIMGPNGSGKSTLARVLAGDPQYDVTSGEVWYKGQDLLEMDPEDRAHAGVFMSFQYPIEVPGVSNVQFLRTAYNAKQKAHGDQEISPEEFEKLLDEKMEEMNVRPEFKKRSVNVGFSGGEKKRNEILQMAVLRPELTLLDETDSGLDIDALRVVASGVNHYMNKDVGLVLITHYQRLLDYIKPDFVHVMVDGKIVQSGGPELALELEEKGYDWLETSVKEGAR